MSSPKPDGKQIFCGMVPSSGMAVIRHIIGRVAEHEFSSATEEQRFWLQAPVVREVRMIITREGQRSEATIVADQTILSHEQRLVQVKKSSFVMFHILDPEQKEDASVIRDYENALTQIALARSGLIDPNADNTKQMSGLPTP